jgi:hypothetical protein
VVVVDSEIIGVGNLKAEVYQALRGATKVNARSEGWTSEGSRQDWAGEALSEILSHVTLRLIVAA